MWLSLFILSVWGWGSRSVIKAFTGNMLKEFLFSKCIFDTFFTLQSNSYIEYVSQDGLQDKTFSGNLHIYLLHISVHEYNNS